MNIRFKKCTEADLADLVAISRKTFVDAFEKDNDPDDFKTYVDKAFEESNIEQQLLNLNSEFYFTFEAGVLVGYFKLNEKSAQTDLKNQLGIELERIYILEKFQGKQIGKQMLLEAITLASKRQSPFIWLGVWQENKDAVRFYEKNGFVKCGTHPYYIGKDKQTDWLLRYEL